MAPFPLDAPFKHSLDWRLLQNGPITAYSDRAAFKSDIAWLERAGYECHVIGAEALDEEDFHLALQRTLGLTDSYGLGLDALSDVLEDPRSPIVPDQTGLVFGLDRFDRYRSPQPLLDALARAARTWLLMGRRLITLVCLEHEVSLGPIGCLAVQVRGWDWLSEERPLEASGQLAPFVARQGKDYVLRWIREAHPASFADEEYRNQLLASATMIGATSEEVGRALSERKQLGL